MADKSLKTFQKQFIVIAVVISLTTTVSSNSTSVVSLQVPFNNTTSIVPPITMSINSSTTNLTATIEPSIIPLVPTKPPKESELLKIDLEHAICGQNINLREITILQLQQAFKTKKLTAEELVRCYLKRIELMNPFLNAVLEVNPDAIEIAKQLDKDRENGIYYGLLHGIPVLIKDSIGTADKMETTAGSIALLGLKPKFDAEVVKKLRKAGAIIIGKANLSEFGYFRGTDLPSGWSGRGGQTNNAYKITSNPCGSSSGSAVAVAANLVTVALGGETDGSIICPSEYASLVGLKPGIGVVSTTGAIGISHTQDVIGPMTRTATDAFILFSKIASSGINFDDAMIFAASSNEIEDNVPFLKNSKVFRVGILRQPYSRNSDSVNRTFESIFMKLRDAGLDIIDPVEFDEGTQSSIKFSSEDYVLFHEFKYGLNEYLKNSVVRTSTNTTINSLADIIQFNIENPPKEGYNQAKLIAAEATDGILNTTYLANRNKNKLAAQNYFDFMLTKYSLDAILIPSSYWSFAAISGYPDITVPAGFYNTGYSYGISLYGGRGSEETLLQIALILENVHKGRRTSLFLD